MRGNRKTGKPKLDIIGREPPAPAAPNRPALPHLRVIALDEL